MFCSSFNFLRSFVPTSTFGEPGYISDVPQTIPGNLVCQSRNAHFCHFFSHFGVFFVYLAEKKAPSVLPPQNTFEVNACLRCRGLGLHGKQNGASNEKGEKCKNGHCGGWQTIVCFNPRVWFGERPRYSQVLE